MPHFEIVKNTNEIELDQWVEVVEVSKFNSKNRLVDEKGKKISTSNYSRYQYRIISKFERNLTRPHRYGRGLLGALPVICSLALTFFSSPLALILFSCTLGVAYFSKSYRGLFTKQKENVRFGKLDESNKFTGAECENLTAGLVRKGKGGGTAPSFIGTNNTIDTFQLVIAGFAACFHTTESHEEILELLKGIRQKNPTIFRTEIGAIPLPNLYSGLAGLIKALPGEQDSKEVKIYWNECAEKHLILHFFNNESIEVDDLVFAILPGEECQAPFQAAEMNFNNQLQFIGIGKEKIFDHLREKIEGLSQEIVGKNIFSEVEKITNEKKHPYPLMDQAYKFTLQKKVIEWLLNVQRDKPHIDSESLEISIRQLITW